MRRSRINKIQLIVYIRSSTSNKVAGKVVFYIDQIIKTEKKILQQKSALVDCPVQATLQTKVKLQFIKHINKEQISQSSLASAFKKKQKKSQVAAKLLPNDKQRRMIQVEQQLNVKQNMIETLRKEIKVLNNEMIRRNNAHQKQIAQMHLKQRLRTSQTKIKELQQQLKEYRQIQNDLADAQKQIETIQKQKKQLQKKIVGNANKIGSIFNLISQLGGPQLLHKVMIDIGVKQY